MLVAEFQASTPPPKAMPIPTDPSTMSQNESRLLPRRKSSDTSTNIHECTARNETTWVLERNLAHPGIARGIRTRGMIEVTRIPPGG